MIVWVWVGVCVCVRWGSQVVRCINFNERYLGNLGDVLWAETKLTLVRANIFALFTALFAGPPLTIFPDYLVSFRTTSVWERDLVKVKGQCYWCRCVCLHWRVLTHLDVWRLPELICCYGESSRLLLHLLTIRQSPRRSARLHRLLLSVHRERANWSGRRLAVSLSSDAQCERIHLSVFFCNLPASYPHPTGRVRPVCRHRWATVNCRCSCDIESWWPDVLSDPRDYCMYWSFLR